MAPENSTRPFKTIIIGAGAGGCALAVYLAQQGFDVQVVEKNETVGGRCGQITRAGHRFDLGATLMLMPRLFRSIFSDWGERLEDRLRLERLDPLYQIYFENGGRLDFTSNREALKAQLEKREPGSFGQWLKYFSLGCRQYRELMRLFLGRNFYGFGDYFNPANLLPFLKLHAHCNYFKITQKFFKHPELLAAFSFQNIYVGQSPYAASAAYILLSAMELEQGGFYPQGGMHQIVKSMVALSEKHGAKFRFNAPVEEIMVENHRARGVRLESGEVLPADLVIANADLPYVNRRLLPEPGNPGKWERFQYTCSALVYHWGLDRAFPQLGHHNVFLAQDYRGGFDAIFQGRSFGASPHFYLNHPTHTDPGAAPPGHDSVTVIVPAAHQDDRRPQDWGKLGAEGRAGVLRRLGQMGLPDLESHIKFEIAFTPPLWERSLNLTHGAVFGSLAHSLRQVGYLRPANQHPRYPNLFFVGGSTHPGSGVPLTLLSARLVAERIFRTLRLPRPAAWRALEF